MLIVDAYLWWLSPQGYSGGAFAPQAAARVSPSGNGNSAIDRYRHGKLPPVVQGGSIPVFDADPRSGRVAFNVLYCDGRAETVYDYRQGYKAIRMRLP
jgi:prepilin-type processing-associated H-X9-DG protein